MASLFSKVQLGALELPHRVLFAPCTRCRVDEGHVPKSIVAEYYRQRSSAGLIVTEGTVVSPQGFPHTNIPGIMTDAQVASWRNVTNAVHKANGRIFLQLWHVGRASHCDYQPGGEAPVAPSALQNRIKFWDGKEMKPHSMPRALKTEEIPRVVEEFAQGARRAKEAGFDGVEIHGANGYLIDQFIRDGTNHRTDQYGGSALNRARFALEIAQAVVEVWGANHVGFRMSPAGTYNDMSDSNNLETFGTLLRELQPLNLAYAHIIRVTAKDRAHGAKDDIGPRELRTFYRNPIVATGGFDRQQAEEHISNGWADAVGFGMSFVANPDLPERLRRNAPLNVPDVKTFYTTEPEGYLDYPTLPASGTP
eukprot:GGOE01045445.1.p1 GENE.GGOE01045445.1~~GGOE01045445.1.p1  ORF type:complete len:376 (+),score=72.50 GGOE01045445.1:35-1129(+)